jgi:uncharacterized protein (DUF433 family)
MEAVSERDGELYVADTDVPLIGVLAGWQRGESVDDICDSFPALTPAQVEAVFTYYSERSGDALRLLREYDEFAQRAQVESYARNPERYDQLRERKLAWREMLETRESSRSHDSVQSAGRDETAGA